MAYILRSMAVIGVIALNSPVHGGKSGEADPAPAIREPAAVSLPVELRSAGGALTAAREAAQILAGLDPDTRERLMNLAASAATGRNPSR